MAEEKMSDNKGIVAQMMWPTRRQAIAGAALAFGCVALRSPFAHAAADEEIARVAETIHQEPIFKASRKRVYEALTDAKQFDTFSRLGVSMKSAMPPGAAPTEISREVGGAFTIFGGHIVGRHLELVPSERIVQAWRVVDWAPGIYSIAKFVLVEDGSATKIVLDHSSFPKGLAEHLAAGWKGNYWEPLAKFLA
jgi:activator of HSP90 ATPase